MSNKISKSGGCQCGLIRYVVRGAPMKNVTVCHCRMCQKAMGNIFGVFATFRSEDFSWTRGAPTKFRSSSNAYRLFCSNCGTPVAFLPFDETAITITVGSLDCPSEMAPAEQIGFENAIAWTKTLSDLPARTTDEYNTQSSTTVTYQHPDHETMADDWLQKMEKTK